MIIKNVNVNRLHQEFNDSGIYPFPVIETSNGDGDFSFPEDSDMQAVNKIISSHLNTPNVEHLTDIEKLRQEQARASTELIEIIISMLGRGAQ